MKKFKYIFFIISFCMIFQNIHAQEKDENKVKLFTPSFKYPNQKTDFVYKLGFKQNFYQKFEFVINADNNKSYEDTAYVKNLKTTEIYIGRQLGIANSDYRYHIATSIELYYNFCNGKNFKYNQLGFRFGALTQIYKLRSEIGFFGSIGYYFGSINLYTGNENLNSFQIFPPISAYYKFIFSENFAILSDIGFDSEEFSVDKKVRFSENWHLGIGIEYRLPTNFNFKKTKKNE